MQRSSGVNRHPAAARPARRSKGGTPVHRQCRLRNDWLGPESQFPINKALWTISYVLFTAVGVAVSGSCYWLIDIKGYRAWAKPFIVFGVNAIVLFVGSGVMARLMELIKFPAPDGRRITLHGWIFEHLFLSWASPINASLAFAIVFILFWLGLMWILYRRKIIIKI